MKTDKATLEKLRRDLPTIRSIAGWSAERLAELLGVSRVTVVNLENTENKMSVIQYLAIRKLIDEEIKDSGNSRLEWAVTFLVDRDDVPEAAKTKLREDTERIAKKVGRKAGSKTLGEMLVSEISPETIDRGKAILDDLLSRPVASRHPKSKGGETDE